MGQKDLQAKKLEDFPEVFADILNVLLFHGKRIVEPDRLEPASTESIYKADTLEDKYQLRDTKKYWKDASMEFCIADFGMENQAQPDVTMPVRLLSYDAASYVAQVKNKEHLRPVVTIVLNFSEQRWNVAKSLGEMFSVPEELKPFFQDYGIHVFDIAYLSDDVVKQFTSTFKHVAHFFSNKRKVDYRPLDEKIERLPEFVELLRVFSNDARYDEILPVVLAAQKKKGDEVTMDAFIDTLLDKGRAQGIEKGIEKEQSRMVLALLSSGMSPEEISERCILPLETIKRIEASKK